MKKRVFCCLLSAVLLLGCCAGCGARETESSSDNQTTTTTPPRATMSTVNPTKARDLHTFLNDPINNGFIGPLNLYSRPEEINLYFVLSEGAGISRSYDELTEVEKKADIYADYAPDFIFKQADIEAFLQEKVGISMNQLTNGIGDIRYSAEYGLYAISHTDRNYHPITIDIAMLDKNDQYLVTYYVEYDHDALYTVTLAKTDDSYRFVSNVKA